MHPRSLLEVRFEFQILKFMSKGSLRVSGENEAHDGADCGENEGIAVTDFEDIGENNGCGVTGCSGNEECGLSDC